MATRIRTLNFLPEIFKTPTNAQFLSATLDQIVAQPNTKRIEGYVGSKFGYGVNAKDKYVIEPTKVRTDYQLDPGVVFLKKDTSIAQDFISYPGIIDGLELEGGVVNNNNRLFTSQIYSWDSFTNLDKNINFNQYYWLPEGPAAVTVSTETVYYATAYNITDTPNGYIVTAVGQLDGSVNPTLTLLRGGTYTFNVSQTSSFWIQGAPGITGYSLTQPNVQTRDVFGVDNNGAEVGEVIFTVPYKTAQDEYNFPGNNLVDVVSTLPYDQVNGVLVSDLVNGIDGITSLEGLTVMFYNTGVVNEQGFVSKFYDTTLYDEDGGTPGYTPPGTSADYINYDGGYYTDVSATFYTITYEGSASAPVIRLVDSGTIPIEEKITATYGTEFIGIHFYRSTDDTILQIPYLSSLLDILYYQDGTSSNKVGQLKLIESNTTNRINVLTDIIGRKTYTAPNGVVFTNGLKVIFSGDVYPSSYENIEYYVEGVGTAIELIPVTTLIAPEPFTVSTYIPFDSTPYDMDNYDNNLYIPVYQDYITIARNSIDKNAWSRSNRWFHIEVINATASYNNTPELVTLYATPENKAKRPIIEFYPNLRLFDTGIIGKVPVDFIDIRTTNAFTRVADQENYYPDVEVYTGYVATINALLVAGTSTTITIDATKIYFGYKNSNGTDVIGQFQIGQYITDTTNLLPRTTQITDISTASGITTLTVTWSGAQTIGSTVVASLIANDQQNDEYALFNGARIVFTADTNIAVRNKIYIARFSIIVEGSPAIITLTEADDGMVLPEEQTVAFRGYTNQGKDFHFDGIQWQVSQQKTTVNQPPLFDIFDSNGISFGNPDIYAGTSFTGNKLFAYGLGSGTDDAVLGFPLRYSAAATLGDISFDVSLNSDTFNYVNGSVPVNQKINTGYVYNYSDLTTYARQLGWQTAIAPSVQYQMFEFNYYAATPIDTYTCDIAKISDTSSEWPTIQVFVNNTIQAASDYIVTTTASQTIITFMVPNSEVDTVVEVLLLSDQVSETAYYSIPDNLNNNPLNGDVTIVNVGDIRGQYQSSFYNNMNSTGVIFGSNNYRDLGNMVPYANKIIQNSASLVLPGAFIRKQNHNLFNALLFNSREYITFKTLLVDTVNNTAYSTYMSPAFMLDDALDLITASKTDSNSFFWSDMLPSKAAYITNTYSFANSMDVSIYPLSKVYNFATANYNGVLVYLTSTNGIITQLITGVDYTVSTDSPSLTVTLDLSPGDQITIKEYNQTYGSYAPNTPTKLGLYPSTIPEVVLDTGYSPATYFIVGHDGSFNKLYGDYIDGKLIDFRDQVLLEYEKRIYNNLKLSNVIPIQEYEVLPGFFRETDYSYDEIIQIYSSSFLNWVGQNRINYKKQFYNNSNEYTYNYNQSGNKINRAVIPQGYWRGVYEYFYDTSNPDTNPWEMLGFTDKPTWWETRYGAAPYTSDNLVLWNDLAQGIDWNNGNPIVIATAVRPQLLQVLPVDSAGNLVSPFVSIVGNYSNQSFNKDWKVGDVGPAEFSYRRSSSWPFDLMRILALTKPAEFFNLGVDIDNYKYNAEFNQYLVNDRSHLVISDVEIYGNGTAKTSYINWIVDFEKQVGIDATTNIIDLLFNIDVRLVYRLAGFSDKNLLKFYVEKASANSNNSSLLIPDESYQVLLYDNQPFERIVYSSVVIQLTSNGYYKVFGNSQTNAYFNILLPQINGNYDRVSVQQLSVQLAKNYYNTPAVVAYGTEFYNVQEVAQFLEGYGRQLSRQGVLLDQIEGGLEVNWRQMVAEFLYWAQCGWEAGSIVNINPAAVMISINKDSNIVQPLTLQQQNFILNQNLYPIQNVDLNIIRDGTLFSAQPLNVGDTIAYGQFNISNFEHGIVFDNVTLFDDIIYNLITGLRQNRIALRGTKTADWNGTVDAQGFILNQDNILAWSKEIKYTTGSIVKYKNKYWIAITIIQAKEIFDERDWKVTDYNEIQKGLLPNTSTRSYESTLYYDVNKANLENDADLLSFSLIGYRPRDYLALADLTDITQINVYKNFIKNKGTLNAASAFNGATLAQGGIDYDIYENWAIKSGEFGGVLNSNFIDIKLNETELTGNPSIVGLTNGIATSGVQQEVPIYSIYNYGRPITSPDVLPLLNTDTPSTLFPSAGYANFNDMRIAAYYYFNLATSTSPSGVLTPLSKLYVGQYVWLANYQGTWQVMSPVSLGQVIFAKNNLNGTATITFNSVHNLTKYQPFAVVNFNTTINGYYIANAIIDPYSILVNINLDPSITTVTGQGIGFRFQSQRVATPSDIIDLPLLNNEFVKNKVWVDTNNNGDWAVYRKSINYSYNAELLKTGSETYGSAVAYSTTLGYLLGDADAGKVYRYSYNALFDTYILTQTLTGATSFGTTIAYADDIFVISQPTGATTVDRTISIYQLVINTLVDELQLFQAAIQAPAGVTNWGSAIAISGDTNWLYISDTANNSVHVYVRSPATEEYEASYIIDGDALGLTTTGDNFGYSLTTDYYGNTVAIGAPDQNYIVTVSPDVQLENWGYTYVFDRTVQNFEVPTSSQSPATQTFTLSWTPASILLINVNGTPITAADYSVTDATLTMNCSLTAGDIITVSGNNFVQSQTLTTQTTPKIGVQFGQSVDTTTYATEILVGAPFESNSQNQEGAVYRFTNGGGKYGMIIGTSNCTITTSRTILINGYQVVLFTGDATLAASTINNANITNIQAASLNGKLIIQLIDTALALPNNKLTVTTLATSTWAELGFNTFTQTQVINDPHVQSTTQFGNNIKFNESGSFIVSAPTATRYEATTFDSSDDEDYDNDTLFDNNATQWVDTYRNAGAVYMYDYLSVYNESLLNAGNFVYAQSVNDINETYGAQPLYGHALDFNNSHVIIGTPNFRPDFVNGQVIVYDNSTGETDWSVFRSSNPVVDIARIQDIQLYSAETNNTLDNLDYIDPLQGKILGSVRQNIDVVSNSDPAGYNSPNVYKGAMVWGTAQLGQIWFNTSNTRFVNYHQNDIVYNSKWWGAVFPGSDVTVYSWITSNVPPALYAGPGIAFDSETYAIEYILNATGILAPVYFYWVRNTNIVFTKIGKTLSDSIIQSYIASPINSGISYFAPLQQDIFALYNSGSNINNQDSVLHIGFSTGTNDDVSHSVYNLIRTNYADDFLPGLPGTNAVDVPESLYDRMLDSMCGVDESGAVVPDPYLPRPVQYGIYARPRQSFFVNRFLALKNYLMYANEILAQYPIAEIRIASFLTTEGAINPSTVSNPNWSGPELTFYNTADYWSYINWWAVGYDNNTKSALQVPIYADLATLNASAGLIVTVNANGDGKTETYVYTDIGSWDRIGLTDGTIEFSSALWDYSTARLGFGDNFFDTTPYDTYPSQETRSIVRALNEEIYTNELLIYRNNSLVLLFKYIQSETIESQNYLPWLNKTSFIDVAHTIRELLPIEVFRSDNQDFLSGYINEVKPYHVVIKEFLFKYTGTDVYAGTITDFDLPAQYNTDVEQFITPELVYANPSAINQYLPTDPIWQTVPYSEWYNNYGLSITGVNNYQITVLASYIALNTNLFAVDNAFGFPINGILLMGDELIGYSNVDRSNNTISGLTRGVDGTPVTIHFPGETITINLPAVLLLDAGRGYTEPPKITAYIDTTIYPEPRRAAILQAVMSLDSILSVNVIDPGAGYAILPKIIIDPSITVSFSASAVSTLTNTIILGTPSLQTGDLITYTVGIDTTAVGGLDTDQYYYVNVLETVPEFVVALYTNYHNALTDQDRVILFNIGTGNNNSLNVSARASCISTSIPIRENQITLRFDRTTYNSQVTEWTPGGFYGSYYAGTYNNSEPLSGTEASSSITIWDALPLETVLSSSQSAVFEIENVTNDQTVTWSSRTRLVTNTYATGNIITIIPSTNGAPDAGEVGPTTGFYVGMPVKFAGAVGSSLLVAGTTYYINTIINSTDITISATTGGSIFSLGNATISPPNLIMSVGQVTNTAVVTLFYPGILTATATTANTNTVTIPLAGVNAPSGTYGFYTDLPVFFTGTVFGGIIENEIYYVVSVIDEQNFTMSTVKNPLIISIAETNSTGNLIICTDTYSTLGLTVNDPVIFTNFTIDIGTTNIDPGTIYYISSIVDNSELTVSASLNGVEFNPGTCTGVVIDGFQTLAIVISQKNNFVLTTASGSMTCNAGLPISPGQITGQQFTLYTTSELLPDLSGTDGNLLTRDIVNALSTGGYLSITSSSGGLSGFYINLPIKFADNYGGLTAGVTYYVAAFGTVQTIVTQTTAANLLLCSSTSGFYNNMPVIFTGTALGGTVLDTTYYVIGTSIVANESFKISTTAGGLEVDLTSESGANMTVTGQLYIQLSATAGGAILPLTDDNNTVSITQAPTASPVFDIQWKFGGYQVTIVDPGEGYTHSNTISISGIVFGGTSANNLVMTVNTIDSYGEILSVISAGTPPGLVTQYYLKVISPSECEVYSDPLLQIPVTGIDFAYTAGDYTLLPDPFYLNQSIVKYNNRVYECIVSNNDSEFVFGKWEPLISDSRKLNALDRITGYYQPTVNMPGLDLTQLVDGITYPNSTYMGNAFAPDEEYILDVILQDQDTVSVYDIQGDAFTAGYGPEELVPGIVSDNLTMTVATRPGTNWDETIYAHVGYNVVSNEITPTVGQVEFSFAELVQSPAQVAVFQINGTTGLGTALSNSIEYTVDWINKIVTLLSSLPAGDLIDIYVYEVGNGDQLVKANSQTDPIRINTTTGFNEIYLNCNYSATISSGSGVIRPGTDPIEIIATETDSTSDSILCENTEYFNLNDQITFQGAVFGGIVIDTHYYVKTISPITHQITISDTLTDSHVAGPTFQLTTASGSMDIILQTGSGTPWTDPIVYHNGTKLGIGHTNRITQTSGVTNTITCNTVDGISIGDTIVFSNTMFGVISPLTTYYIKSIVDFNEFTISATLGGDTLLLSTAAGGATAITNDYAFGIADNGISASIIFAAQYDTAVDYLSYTVFGQTYLIQYGYTVPETEIFTGNDSTTVFTLSNYVSGDNPNNAIVEYNGLRKINVDDYSINSSTNTITLTFTPAAGSTLSVTSYNLTDRQYLNTQYGLTGKEVANIVTISNTITPPIVTTLITSVSSTGNLLTCADTSGFIVDQTIIFKGISIGNVLTTGTVYYVKSVTFPYDGTFTISATLVAGVAGPTFDPGTGSGNMPTYVGGQPAVRVESGIQGLCITNDIIRIDGTQGSVQLNNNTYYVHVIGDPATSTQFDLYNSPYLPEYAAVNDPVTNISSYTGGGYVWINEMFAIVNTWQQDNVDRLWVTINGYRVPSSALYINADNNLSILSTITTGDTIIITSMMPSATPNEEVYLLNVNKSNTPSVYRANTETRTWLVEPLYYTDETIYVQDVSKITDITVQNVVAPAESAGVFSIGLTADKRSISQVIVYNSTTSSYINAANYTVVMEDIAPILHITNPATPVVTAGNNLIITTIVGNLVYINGEQIRFSTVDLDANTITDLQRGYYGTGEQTYIPLYTEVFGIISTNRLPDPDYSLTWNSNVYNPVDGDPLQISETDAAYFLNTDIS